MERGVTWFKLYRKITDSLIFQNEKGLKIWVWCLCKAGYQEKEIIIGRQKIHLDKGQFLIGGIKAEETLKIARTTIYYWLKFLQDEKMVDIKKTNKYTVITILNWEQYQGVDIKSTSNVTSDGQQMDTNNKDKKEEKEYNNNISFEIFWNLYDKKVGDRRKLEKKWDKLNEEEKLKALSHISKYKIAQPDKQYRKNPETYLNNKSWNDEIVGRGNGTIKPNFTEDELRGFSESLFNDKRFK